MQKTALFVRRDSPYKERGWDCWDADRDARLFDGTGPVVAHPPCRAWGIMSHLSFRSHEDPTAMRNEEKQLALFALDVVRRNGGVLEHPSGSTLFGRYAPKPGVGCDMWGGFTISIDQFDFGHVAHKQTYLYVCGVPYNELPQLPPCRKEKALRSITGNVPGTVRCTQYQREYTPARLIDWIEVLMDKITTPQVAP